MTAKVSSIDPQHQIMAASIPTGFLEGGIHTKISP